jgi:hypothetical protein
VHVTDLADYYTRLIQRIIEQRALPAGNDGYYLVSAHTFNWHELLQALANDLRTRGLVLNADVTVWPSEEVKTKSLGLPSPYSDIAWNSKQVSPSFKTNKAPWGVLCTNLNSAAVLSHHDKELGWNPEWNYQRFLREIGEEVDAVLEAGTSVKDLAGLLPNQS